MKFNGNIDLLQNFLLNLRIHSADTAPSSPAEAQLWYDSISKDLKYFDGTNWISAKNVLPPASSGDILNYQSSNWTVSAILKVYNDYMELIGNIADYAVNIQNTNVAGSGLEIKINPLANPASVNLLNLLLGTTEKLRVDASGRIYSDNLKSSPSGDYMLTSDSTGLLKSVPIPLYTAQSGDFQTYLVVGDGSAHTWEILHEFDTENIIHEVYLQSSKETVLTKFRRIDADNAEISTYPYIPEIGETFVVMLFSGFGVNNNKVKITDEDLVGNVLNEKISVIGNIEKTILNPGGNEVIQLSVNCGRSVFFTGTTANDTPTLIYPESTVAGLELTEDSVNSLLVTMLVAKTTDAVHSAVLQKSFRVVRTSGGIVTQVAGAVPDMVDANIDGVTFTAVESDSKIALQVTGLDATNLKWKARVEITELSI